MKIDAAELLKGTTPGPWSVYEDCPKIAAAIECFDEDGILGTYKTASLIDKQGWFRNPVDAKLAAASHALAARVVELEALLRKVHPYLQESESLYARGDLADEVEAALAGKVQP